MTVATIIFDCDGVLVDSEIIYNSVERKHLSRLGLDYDDATYQNRFVGLTDADYLHALGQDYADLGRGPFPDSFATTVKTECVACIESDLKAVDGIQELLEFFTGDTAVASSSSTKELHRKLEITNLHNHFSPHVFSGEQVENGKPAPDLFLLAAQALGQQPRNCHVIEDSVNGVLAGVAAGMTVWGFTGGGHTVAGLDDRLRDAGACRVFSHFSEVLHGLQFG